jgi:antitoxin YobK
MAGVEHTYSYLAPSAVMVERGRADVSLSTSGGKAPHPFFDADFEHSSIPDAVWNTLSLRRDEDIPADLVAIYATGDGEQLCVQSGSSKTPILAIWPGSGDAPEVIAFDFGVWFKEIVEGEIATT